MLQGVLTLKDQDVLIDSKWYEGRINGNGTIKQKGNIAKAQWHEDIAKFTQKDIINRLGSGFFLNVITSILFFGSIAITTLFSNNKLIFLLTLFVYLVNVFESLLLAKISKIIYNYKPFPEVFEQVNKLKQRNPEINLEIQNFHFSSRANEKIFLDTLPRMNIFKD